MRTAGLAAACEVDVFRAMGVLPNQEDWPWWVEGVRGWLAVVRSLQDASGPQGRAFRDDLKGKLERWRVNEVYDLHKRWVRLQNAF